MQTHHCGIGAALPRLEDERFLMGRGRFVDDPLPADTLVAHVVRSPHAHARIVRIDSDLAREVYLTDGHINLAVVRWKRTPQNPDPYTEGYGLDLCGVQVDDPDAADARVKGVGATAQPPPRVDLSERTGRIFFDKKYTLAGRKSDR